MLSFVVKQLKTYSPLRTNIVLHSFPLQTPESEILLRGVRPEHEPSGQTSRLPVTRRTAHPVFQEVLQSSQLRASELGLSTEWITRILTGVKIGVCLLESNGHSNVPPPGLAKYLLLLPFDSCTSFPVFLKVLFFTVFFSLKYESFLHQKSGLQTWEHLEKAVNRASVRVISKGFVLCSFSPLLKPANRKTFNKSIKLIFNIFLKWG